MSDISENHLCYFCDEPYPHPSSFITNYYEKWVCFRCEDFGLPINYNIQENGECPICFEDNILIKLPRCIHKVCFGCCKTIYFGSTTNERPVHWTELTHDRSRWAYEFNDDDENDPVRIKYEEYEEFEIKHIDYFKYNYDELITIRNSLITERPEWMNTEEFINYENGQFRYYTDCEMLEKEWENYNENKIKGNGSCPFCRIK